MKNVKTYENFNDLIENQKKLMTHFINVLNSLGLTHRTYLNKSHIFEIEFDNEKGYVFALIFMLNSDNVSIRIKTSLAQKYDEIIDIIKKVLLEIKSTSYNGNYDTFTIRNVDEFINDFTKDKIKLFQNTNKYNL